MRDHRVVVWIGVFLDVEIFLDYSAGIREERPLRADRRTEFLQRVVIVSSDRCDLRVCHGNLGIERSQFQMLDQRIRQQ